MTSIDANAAEVDRVATPSTSTSTTATVPIATSAPDTDTDSDEPGCAPGVSPDGDPSAGDCPSKQRRVKSKRDDKETGQWKAKVVYFDVTTQAETRPHAFD